MIVRNGKTPKFDIRTLPSLAYDGPESDLVEAAYDTVNRMIIFVGDVPAGTLFTSPWVKLALSCRIEEAEECGLLNNPQAVWAAFDVLEGAGHMSSSKYLNGDVYRDGSDEISLAHRSLLNQGITLPQLSAKPNTNKKRMNALNELIAEAPEISFKQIMSEPIDLRKVDVVRNAVRCAIFDIPSNHKCCDPNTFRCISGSFNDICYFCTNGGSGSTWC